MFTVWPLLFLHLTWTILHCYWSFSCFVLLFHLYHTFHNAWYTRSYSINIWKRNEFILPSPSKRPIHIQPELKVGDNDVSKLDTNIETLISAILRKSCECWWSDEKRGWQMLQGQSIPQDSRECVGCLSSHRAATCIARVVYQPWFISHLWLCLSNPLILDHYIF